MARGFAGLLLVLVFPHGGKATDLTEVVPLPAGAQDGLEVEFSGGLLTVEAHDVVVQTLLEAIASRSGLTLSYRDPLTHRVTIAFNELELPVAIDRLLHGMSYALQYAPDNAGNSASRLWLFSAGDPSRRDESAPSESALADDGAAMRLEAVAALADGDTDPFAFALASALVDESRAVRHEAVYALGEIGGTMSTQFLQHALLDSDPEIRSAAVDALAEIGTEQSATSLAAVLTDPDPALRENAIYALGEIGGPTAVDLLQQSTADSDEFVREAAVDVLRELDDEG